ncbi:MAG TPA: hypothetical protein PKZ74_11500, partial [Bacteroidales bacterium]|nr:hypothetical protein [Bacteroidales bacterium]
MNTILFLIILFLSFWVFILPKSYKYYYTLVLLAGGLALSTIWSFRVFDGSDEQLIVRLDFQTFHSSIVFTIDRLS